MKTAPAENRRGAAGPEPRKRACKEAGPEEVSESITENAVTLADHVVAVAISFIVPRAPRTVRELMRRWEKPILKATIPGAGGRRPTKAMLDSAKEAVLRFFTLEEARGKQSAVVKAFYLASGEPALHFDWAGACRRVRMASFDMRQEVDSWNECLAMTSGETNAVCEIFVCGTKKVTLSALTSLICHEALHNLARRTRQGNPFLSEDTEHVGMALLGDPQLVHMVD